MVEIIEEITRKDEESEGDSGAVLESDDSVEDLVKSEEHYDNKNS